MFRFVRPALIVVLFLVAGPLQLGAQRWMADSAKVLIAQGDSLRKQGSQASWESAGQRWVKAAELYRRLGDRAGLAKATNLVGAVHLNMGRTDSALVSFRQTIGLPGEASDLGSALHNLGITYHFLGQPDSAVAYFRRAAVVRGGAGDLSGQTKSLNGIGVAYRVSGRADSAMVYFRQALELSQQTGSRRDEAEVLTNVANVYLSQGRPDSAVALYHQVLPIAREQRDAQWEGRTLGNIGRTHDLLGRPDSTLAYYTLALVRFRTLGDRREEGRTLGNIGNVHQKLQSHALALQHYRDALTVAQATADRSSETTALIGAGNSYRMSNQPDSAVSYLERALVIAREVRYRETEGDALLFLGLAQGALNRPDSARHLLQGALGIHRERKDVFRESQTLARLADLYRRWPGAQGRTAEAVAYYDSAAAASTAVAGRTGSDVNRVSFTEAEAELLGGWSLAWLARTPEIGPRSAALASLAAAERGRAQALLALLRSATPAKTAASAPAPRHRTDMVSEGQALLASVHRPGTAIVSYALAEDTLLTWLVLPSGEVSVTRQPATRDSIALLVTDFRAGLGADSALARGRGRQANGRGARGEHDRGAGRLLADLLLPPALRRLPAGTEVVIVPQGTLNLVPFAALPQGRRGTYGERFALRYAPSLTTLAETERRPALPAARRDELRRALVAGNPVMPEVEPADAEAAPAAVLVTRGGGTRLEPLPAAEAEARQVATRFRAPLLTGAEASETRIRRELATAPLVHLATHGIVYSSDAKVRQSFLALAPDSLHDGRLTVGEVIDEGPVLSAELVVLSACQTGLGNLRQAEGTVGLQRAFLARGARGVLVSLWSVSDEATGLLMQSFYRHWLDDRDEPSKAEALRRAQADVRRVPKFREPLYWAAFQLVGAR